MRRLQFLLPVLVLALALFQAANTLHWFGLGRTGGSVADMPIAPGGPFRLTGPDGRIVTEHDFRGKWALIYFGYTNCPDVCPVSLNAMASALDTLGSKAADIAPLFISIDPVHDTPAIMGAYTARFDRRIVGLSGTPAEIEKVKRAYHVYAEPRPPMPGGGPMLMDHSSVFVILRPDGQFAEALNGDTTAQVLATRLRALNP